MRNTLIESLEGLYLLEHPFYRRWSMGQVGRDELRDYAAQYRHFERALPGMLEAIARRGEGGLRRQALENLADETGATPHLELFEQFAHALGAAEGEASPAMAHLLRTYARALEAGAAEGFAALWAYEAQASEVAESKAAGLRAHQRLEGEAVAFWDLHARLDELHGEWALSALEESGAKPETLAHWSREAARAWWGFLDEREALRPTARA